MSTFLIPQPPTRNGNSNGNGNRKLRIAPRSSGHDPDLEAGLVITAPVDSAEIDPLTEIINETPLDLEAWAQLYFGERVASPELRQMLTEIDQSSPFIMSIMKSVFGSGPKDAEDMERGLRIEMGMYVDRDIATSPGSPSPAADRPEAAIATFRLVWDVLKGVLWTAATAIHQENMKTSNDAEVSWVNAQIGTCVLANEFLTGLDDALSMAINLKLIEATYKAERFLARIRKQPEPTVDHVVNVCVEQFTQDLRDRLRDGKGKTGRKSETEGYVFEIKQAIRNWQGKETPKQNDPQFLMSIRSLSDVYSVPENASNSRKTENLQAAYSCLRSRVRAGRKAGRLPKGSWKSMFTAIRTQQPTL